MIIFVHTPKCGGKSLKASLIEAYGEGLLLDYANPLKTGVLDSLRNTYTYLKHSPFEKYEVVYGHFSFDRHRKIWEGNKRAMFFREPIDLVGSYYFYLKEKYPGEDHGGAVSFVKRNGMEQFYGKFLGELPVSELDFVGIVERYRESLKLFEKITGKQLEEREANVTKSKPKNYREYFEEEGTLEELTELMKENKGIYKMAKKRHLELCKSNGIK